MRLYELTCVSYSLDIGTMKIKADSKRQAIIEMTTYPAVKYVIACEEVEE